MTDRRSRVIRDCVQGVAENKEGLVCVDLSCWGIGPWLFSDNNVMFAFVMGTHKRLRGAVLVALVLGSAILVSGKQKYTAC